MESITTTYLAYLFGRRLFGEGVGIADAMKRIKSDVPILGGYGHWAASDGYALARRGEESESWVE